MLRLFCLGPVLVLTLGFTRIAPAQVILEGDTCGQAFVNPRMESVACQTGFRLDPAQRAKLERASYGLVSDMSCSANINYRRSDILRQARSGGDVRLPPQAVRCRLLAQGQPFHVSFNMAPLVRIDKGRAVDAELGIREMKGIPEPAATLVAGILNNDPTLRKTLIQAANDILPALPKR